MRPLALAVLLAVALAAIGEQQSAGTTQLVEAAKAAKAKRKASTTRVLTNSDVKKSKGKIGQTSLAATPIAPADTQTLTERHEASKKAAADREARLTAARTAVATLEKTVATIEQQYYEEGDLTRRDTILVPRFGEAKAKLDAARAALATLETEAAPPPAANITTTP
jgi:hypothetical protein